LNVFRSVYREFIYGGHLLALGTASIATCSALILGSTPTLDLFVMAYLFSNGAYTMNRVSELDRDALSHAERTAYLDSRRRLLPYLIITYFLIGYFLAFLRNLYFFAALLVPLFLSLFYSVGSRRFVKFLGVRRLKEQLLVKNLTISFGWSLIPILVGLYYTSMTLPLLLVCPFIFLRLIANTVFFDIRDAQADALYGTRTIPSVYGDGVSNVVMALVDILSLGYMILIPLAGAIPIYAMTLAVFPLYSLLYRACSRWLDQDLIRDLVADAEYIMWAPVVYIGKL
jgi:4-hydroxybenzoate polyprenyltransferase